MLGFPGAAGGIDKGVDRYVEVAEQPTVIETIAPDIAAVLRAAGFHVALVADMDSWLRRHAVFVTAVSGALYAAGGDDEAMPQLRQLYAAIDAAVLAGA